MSDSLPDALGVLPAGRPTRVALAAGLWGLVVFMPVGLTYLGFFATALAVATAGGLGRRWQRLRAHGLFWPLAGFIGWTLVVLALQPHWFPETASNLWHALRIAATLALAAMLTRSEAQWALAGFLLAAAGAVVVMVFGQTLHLSTDSAWHSQLMYAGNKSISNALLLAVLAGWAIAVALQGRLRTRLLAGGMALALLAVMLHAVPSRGALLIALLALPAAALHQGRQHGRRLALALVAMLLAIAAPLLLVDALRNPLALGLSEVRQALQGQVTAGSWNLRMQLLFHTAAMAWERPLLGWGIGAWNAQWQARAPASLAALNMPHNDLLWMAAQAGIPGALAWLAPLTTACRIAWTEQTLAGRLAFVAGLALLAASLVNSATRDAAIGLCLPWIAAVTLRHAVPMRSGDREGPHA